MKSLPILKKKNRADKLNQLSRFNGLIPYLQLFYWRVELLLIAEEKS